MAATGTVNTGMMPTDANGNTIPGFPGLPRQWGESDAAYQARLQAAQQPYQQANTERGQVTDLANTEEAKSRSILDEQGALQKTRLNDLASLLAQQNKTQFNQDIPGIANTAQGQGMLETSGFGNALSRDYTNLQTNTDAEIAKQALADRDLQIQGLGAIGTNSNNLATSGLQRQFSTTDTANADALAKTLAQYGVPAPAPQPSTMDKALQYGGPILSGAGAVKGAANAASATPSIFGV